MDNAVLLEFLSLQISVLALSTTRIAVAFLLLPLFSEEIIPALVRNSIFVVLAIVAATLQPKGLDPGALSGLQWITLFAKEAFIGLVIGFFFGLFLWAFEAAGIIIDTQIGASMAMVYDPLSGHEVTLLGDFLGRWINYLFLATGGLLFFTTAIFESYLIWPVDQPLPELKQATLILFQTEFSRFITLIFMIAAPVVVIIFLVDMSMGLINRFAKRLDIIFISLAIKGLVAILLMTIMVPTIVEQLIYQLAEHKNGIESYLKTVLG